MRTVGLIAAAAFALVSLTSGAHATAIPGLYNTGVGVSGVLPKNGATDSHWTITPAETGLTTAATTYNVDPAGCTYYCTSDAAWLGVSGGGFQSYTYSLSFDLGGLDAGTATLSGLFGADNEASVYLNGHLLASYLADHDGSYHSFQAFQALHAFSASSDDFLAGLNILTFYVTDYDAPSALVVSGLGGTASLARDNSAIGAVPEATTWAMLLGGFGLTGAAMRRRRATRAPA
jgi:hypothetical protein